MRVAIHQPHYLPWLRYFNKLIKSDIFIVLDTVAFTKNGWQNRNRIKSANGVVLLTVPVHARLGSPIIEVTIDTSQPWQRKHWRTIEQNYKKAPFFPDYAPYLKQVYQKEWKSLVQLNKFLLEFFIDALGISTVIRYASQLDVSGIATHRLVELVRSVGGTVYYTGSFAAEQYLDVHLFEAAGIQVELQNYKTPNYPQLYGEFVPDLSIVDLLMNVGKNAKDYLK